MMVLFCIRISLKVLNRNKLRNIAISVLNINYHLVRIRRLKPRIPSIIDIIRNLNTIVGSAQPTCSRWW